MPRGIGRILLIERLIGNTTISGRGRSNSAGSKRRRRLLGFDSLASTATTPGIGSDNQTNVDYKHASPTHSHAQRHDRRQLTDRRVGLANHLELHNALVKRFGPERVLNVALEALSFAQQVGTIYVT